jgi:hypothetical protein
MENQPKKSKALIITIIAILLIVLIGYLLIKNRDSFGVKTSATISRIFSPLIPSLNSKNINKIDENSKRIIAQAGEDIKNGDNVFLSSSSNNGNPIAMLVNGNSQSQSGDMFGFANEDILNGDTGEIIVNPNDGNTFWKSFSIFLESLFGNDSGNNTMPAPSGGWNFDGQNWDFDPNGNGGWVFDPDQNIWTPPGDISLPPNGGWNFDGQNWDFDPDGSGGWNFDPDTGDWTPPEDGWDFDPDTGDWTYHPACSDTKDNDNDNLIDTLDPSCHIGGVLTGEYLPNHYSESSNPPSGGECINGATNYPICTIEIGSECTNGATNPPACDNNQNGLLPDLKAGTITPTTGNINNPIVLSSLISNIGNGSTGGSFSAFFNITTTNPNVAETNTEAGPSNGVSKNKIKNTFVKIVNKIPWVSKAIGAAQPGDTLLGLNIELKTVVPIILKNNTRIATVIYNFSTERTYYIRACADKNGIQDNGTVEESNENNNCGGWTTFTATNSLPVDGDSCTNGADNYPTCTTKNGQCLNGATNPPLCTDEDGTNPTEEDPIINQCLLIDKNPLTFTDSEKAELATLLRKFYLIAPNLKTEDDINLIYTEIGSYEEFASQLDGLINQCYDQGIRRDGSRNPKFELDPLRRYGNPWYKYAERQAKDNNEDNTDSVYMDYNVLRTEGSGCKTYSGYLSGTNIAGVDCETFNTITQNLAPKCDGNAYENPMLNGNLSSGLFKGCKWNPGTYFTDYERVLNIW